MNLLLNALLPFALGVSLGGSSPQGGCCDQCPPDCCVVVCSPDDCPPGCCVSGSCCTR